MIHTKNDIAEKYIAEKEKSSAFPFTAPTGYYESGMSLKEYYAGVALNAIIQSHFSKDKNSTYQFDWIDLCRQAEAFGRLMIRAIAEERAEELQRMKDILDMPKDSDVSDSEEQTGGWG